MKQYEVYTQYFSPIKIEAERVVTYGIDDKPMTIKFEIGNYTVAQFYVEHISGWKELQEDE